MTSGAVTELCRCTLFSDLSGGRQPEAEVLVINRRNLQALGVSEGVLLAEFAELCLAPRSAINYTQPSERYHLSSSMSSPS